MRNQPQGENLLVEAIRTLNTHILPTLSSENRYQLLMVLKALELVKGEITADSFIEKNLNEHLKKLLKLDNNESDNLIKVSEEIRKGNFDYSERMYELLKFVVTFKLMETNPSIVSDESKQSLQKHFAPDN